MNLRRWRMTKTGSSGQACFRARQNLMWFEIRFVLVYRYLHENGITVPSSHWALCVLALQQDCVLPVPAPAASSHSNPTVTHPSNCSPLPA